MLLLGAELNAEMEYHVYPDTTRDPKKPMGERGAYVADHAPGLGAEPSEARQGVTGKG